jgi:nicotinamidase-related amidase
MCLPILNLSSWFRRGKTGPARDCYKHVYSPFFERRLLNFLQQRRVDGMVITGTETDVCVLATVLGAIDFGYRVVMAIDALCSSSDATHEEALLTLYRQRFAQQIETEPTPRPFWQTGR